ncbi:MAG: deoxyribodipyrimidine photolyase [Actinomycetales bacterium]|nr:deoxyribodipyrimidine photolyase [Actinomycetales bacterium]
MTSRRLVLVAFDQLNADHGALAAADPAHDVVLLIESTSMLEARPWHPERTYLLLSAAAHFARDLIEQGFTVDYRQAATIEDGIRQARADHGIEDVVSTWPTSFAAARRLEGLGVHLVPNDLFLTSREQFDAWVSRQRTFRMEGFYREQRRRLGILMDGDEPVGGSWNFDAANRLPPPKDYRWPSSLVHEHDEIDEKISRRLGHQPSGAWGTTRAAALRQLEHFLEHSFAGFGPLEDAMPADDWAVHHSLLSPYLNIGLLHPEEVVRRAVARFDQGGIPIESCEALVRQIIGWREYVHGMYWFLGHEYRFRNALDAHRDLPPVFTGGDTDMNCVGTTVADIDKRAWVHHIPRLMILSNLALLAGVEPQQFLAWMREAFVDAYDWVMVPNVIGMGLYADGGTMMTKPYAAGGAYISRMSTFCRDCAFDPRKRVGPDACPFTTLYWDFLDRHRERFARNARMAQQVRGLDRLSDLDEVRQRAREVLDLLDAGRL